MNAGDAPVSFLPFREVDMPSPFPGMDPFVEAYKWLPMHHELCSESLRQLAPRLRPKYVVESIERDVPDYYDGENTATPVPHVHFEIRSVSNGQIVTVVEILSLTNKFSGHEEYLARRRRILKSGVHLVEIDLLASGRHLPLIEQIPKARYYIWVSRAERQPRVDVYSIQLREPLPVIPIPLLPGDADIPLDLALAFRSIYEMLGWGLSLNYSTDPDVHLDPEERAWLDKRLKDAGLR